jgi:hypothetical protein
MERLIVKFADRPTAGTVSASEDKCLPSGCDRRDEDIVIRHIIFQIRVLN